MRKLLIAVVVLLLLGAVADFAAARIFEDRRNVIKFVCEVPTAIDQRLFALGRTIQQEIE